MNFTPQLCDSRTQVTLLQRFCSWDSVMNQKKFLWKIKFSGSFPQRAELYNFLSYKHRKFSSVTQLCPTLSHSTDCSMPGFLSITNSWSLLKLMSIKLLMPSNISSSITPFFSCLQSFPASGSFPVSQFFASGGQSIGVSALASVHPVNIQDWLPLELTGLILHPLGSLLRDMHDIY